MTKVQLALHEKNLSITMKWADIIGVNTAAAASIDAVCAKERQRHIDLIERQEDCSDAFIVEDLLSSMITNVEEQLKNIKSQSCSRNQVTK